jgi:hypothetical protein
MFTRWVVQFLRVCPADRHRQEHRNTGRTHRMPEAAKAEARIGRAVYVVAATTASACYLRQRLGQDGADLCIKVETPEQLGSFDWHTLSLRGAHPRCKVFVDHYAIEAHFAQLLEELHRYDRP